MAGPSSPPPSLVRELGFNIDLIVIPDFSSKGPSPFQKPKDSEMPAPQPFLFLAPTWGSSEALGSGIRHIGCIWPVWLTG